MLAFINQNTNTQGSYQIHQSKITLGSGGLLGKGLGSGYRKLKFLPEAHKDYIYAVVGEETGFIGTCLILVLFGILVFSSFEVSTLTVDNFDRFIAVGIGGLFGFQFLLHAAVVTDIIPPKGTTLPFFSVGGSSFLINILALGLLSHIAKKTCFENTVDEDFKDLYVVNI